LPKDHGDRQIATMPSNILDRQFEAARPNQNWIADFTYIWTAEGWLYVSAVIDLFSRQVVGWSMSAGMTDHDEYYRDAVAWESRYGTHAELLLAFRTSIGFKSGNFVTIGMNQKRAAWFRRVLCRVTS
jgi:transposase InsO family protein